MFIHIYMYIYIYMYRSGVDFAPPSSKDRGAPPPLVSRSAILGFRVHPMLGLRVNPKSGLRVS